MLIFDSNNIADDISNIVDVDDTVKEGSNNNDTNKDELE